MIYAPLSTPSYAVYSSVYSPPYTASDAVRSLPAAGRRHLHRDRAHSHVRGTRASVDRPCGNRPAAVDQSNRLQRRLAGGSSEDDDDDDDVLFGSHTNCTVDVRSFVVRRRCFYRVVQIERGNRSAVDDSVAKKRGYRLLLLLLGDGPRSSASSSSSAACQRVSSNEILTDERVNEAATRQPI
jgi:hypothetical protein